MVRRRKWFQSHPKAAKKAAKTCSGEEMGEYSGERTIYSAQDFIPFSLEYVPLEINYTYCSTGVQCHDNEINEKKNSSDKKTKDEPAKLDKKENSLPVGMTTTTGDHGQVRYFRCVAGVTVRILKKLLRNKFDLKYHHDVELFYKYDPLMDDYSILDLAYIYSWKKTMPIALYYKISDLRSVQRNPTIECPSIPMNDKSKTRKRISTCTITTQTEEEGDEKSNDKSSDKSKVEEEPIIKPTKKVVAKKKKLTNENVALISPQPRADVMMNPINCSTETNAPCNGSSTTYSLSPSVSITPIPTTFPSNNVLAPVSRPPTPIFKAAFVTPSSTPTSSTPSSITSLASLCMSGPPAFPGMKPKSISPVVSSFPSSNTSSLTGTTVCAVQPLAINGCTIRPIVEEEPKSLDSTRNPSPPSSFYDQNIGHEDKSSSKDKELDCQDTVVVVENKNTSQNDSCVSKEGTKNDSTSSSKISSAVSSLDDIRQAIRRDLISHDSSSSLALLQQLLDKHEPRNDA